MNKLREIAERIRDRLSTRRENIEHHQAKLKRLRLSQDEREKAIRTEIGKIKRLRVDQADDRERLARVKAKIKELEERGVRISGNTVTGGTPGERFVAACLAAVKYDAEHYNRFYSQAGSWTVAYPITGEPRGYRSDCSQFVLSIIRAAGLPDPGDTDFTGGYTGTLVLARNGWKQVSLSALQAKGWGYVVYGGGEGHHVEAHIGPGDRTAGHGDSRVNFGVDNLFGDGDYSCFIYEGN